MLRFELMNFTSAIATAAVLSLLGGRLPGADLVKGYTKYAGSELLEVNNPGAGGEILFVDQTATGGADLTANFGNPDYGWVVDGSSEWLPGDTVSFTGLALPVWADDPDTVATNNTQNATWTLKFYSTGANDDWEGTNNLGSSDDSLIGTTVVNFVSAGAGLDEYHVVFDTPVTWLADSSKIWFRYNSGGKAVRLKTGPAGADAIREIRTSGASVSTNPTLTMSLAGTVIPLLPPPPTVEWAPGGGDSVSLYQEANWIDPATGITPAAGTVNPNVDLDLSLSIHTGLPGGGSGAGGNLMMGSGELLVSRATLRMSAGQSSGIDMGGSNRDFTMIDAKVLSHFISGGKVAMRGSSEMTLYGDDPLVGTTIDLQSPDSFVFFLNRLPAAIDGAYLENFTVSGAPAVLDSNVEIRQYYNGAVIRSKLPSGVVLKAFELPDLAGTRWDFTTGFKGTSGLGLSAYDSGVYTIAGWGADIWGTGDEFHYAYRSLSGDGEIVARVDSVQETQFWAKAGVMIREDLSDASRNAFIFQRPDNQVAFQTRTGPGGTTSSSGAAGGTTDVKWLRLVRTGDIFTSHYSTDSATGPWTQLGSGSIAMPTTVHVGLAVTSHIGVERCTGVFSEVSIVEGGVAVGPPGELGLLESTAEIDAPWARDDRISSFLLKQGYMVTVAADAGGQGASQVYAATQADLKINLPPELDNQVSFMRVLPWRWVARKGWAGGNGTQMAAIGAFWNYEWEPTGASTLNREFVPMIKGRGQDKDFRWEEVRTRGNQTHFLGFNEPMSADQGDLSVAEAIALWPKAQQLGLRLGSPARTDGANGDNWLQDFMTAADTSGYRVDYVCVHNYNKKTGAALKTWLDAEFAKYGLPIWLTEFQRETDDNPSAAAHQAYLEDVLPMLEDLDYLERYAYYNWNTNASNPNDNASLFNGDNSANALGQVYAALFSNPGYANTGQPPWATASVDLVPGEILLPGEGGVITASTSLDTGSIASVEFFANGLSLGIDGSAPFELAIDSLPGGLQTIHTVVTTIFGERIVSLSRQAYVTAFELLPPSPGPAGEIWWSAVPGESYRLESSADPASPSWDLVERRVASAFVEIAADPDWGMAPARFYRVVWE